MLSRATHGFFWTLYLLLLAAAAIGLALGDASATRPLGYTSALTLFAIMLLVLAAVTALLFHLGFRRAGDGGTFKAGAWAGLICALGVPVIYAVLDWLSLPGDLGALAGGALLAFGLGWLTGRRLQRSDRR